MDRILMASRCVMIVVLVSSAWAGQEGLIESGASLQKLAGDFKFTEGPACDAEGNVFFTDQPNDRILKWSANGSLSTFPFQNHGRPMSASGGATGALSSSRP